jgi:hypothetical protein
VNTSARDIPQGNVQSLKKWQIKKSEGMKVRFKTCGTKTKSWSGHASQLAAVRDSQLAFNVQETREHDSFKFIALYENISSNGGAMNPRVKIVLRADVDGPIRTIVPNAV